MVWTSLVNLQLVVSGHFLLDCCSYISYNLHCLDILDECLAARSVIMLASLNNTDMLTAH